MKKYLGSLIALAVLAVCIVSVQVRDSKAQGSSQYYGPYTLKSGVGNTPLAVTNGTATNLIYRLDMSSFKDLAVQFTGSNVANLTTNTTSIVFGRNNDGSTNIEQFLTWSFGMTNQAAYTYCTNLSSGNSYAGAIRFLYVYTLSCVSNTITNFSISLNPK